VASRAGGKNRVGDTLKTHGKKEDAFLATKFEGEKGPSNALRYERTCGIAGGREELEGGGMAAVNGKKRRGKRACLNPAGEKGG